MRRQSLRILKSYDTYTIKTGSAGFVQLLINGKRVQPKNITKTFNIRVRQSDNSRNTRLEHDAGRDGQDHGNKRRS